MANYFKAEWSTAMKVSTAVLTAVLLAAAVSVFSAAANAPTPLRAALLLTATALLLVTLFSYLLSPLGYSLDGENLTIDRKMKPIVIPLKDISRMEPAAAETLSGSLRLLGNDGLWGCYGKFSNAGLGEYNLYIRSRKTLVLIECASKYVIAPERPQEFLQNLQLAITAAKRTGGAK